MAEHGAPPADSTKKDCGCGCGGDCGDKGKAATSPSPGRRALLTGASSAVLIATLVNRRAFAQLPPVACGPISHIGSLQPSVGGNPNLCGGLTGGFWRQKGSTCLPSVLGGAPGTLTLGTFLPQLATAAPSCYGLTFTAALCNSSSPCRHWAVAILDALSPSLNPSYGYTLAQLQAAVQNALNQGVTGSAILAALVTLENDYNVNSAPPCATPGADLCAG